MVKLVYLGLVMVLERLSGSEKQFPSTYVGDMKVERVKQATLA